MKDFHEFGQRFLKKFELELAFPFAGWILSFFAVLVQQRSPLLFLVLLVSLLLISPALIKPLKKFDYSANLLAKLLLALAFLASLFTGGLNSPIMPLLLGAFIYTFTLESSLTTMVVLTLLFLSIVGGTYIMERNFFLRFYVPLILYTGTLILSLGYIYLIQSRRFKSSPSDFLALSSDYSVENIWTIFDIERALLKAANENDLINAYFQNLPFCPPICRLILISRVEQKATLYRLNLDSREVTSSEIKTGFNYEKSTPPVFLSDQNGKKYKLTTYNDFFALYHEARREINQFEHFLKLTDAVLLENLTRMKMAQYKNLLFDNLISLQLLVREIQKTGNLRDFFEIILLTLKKIALFEKAFYVPCEPNKTNSPAFDQKLIKGLYIRLPEEEWSETFRYAVSEAASQRKTIILKKDKVTVIAVPISTNEGCFAVIGGITTSRTNLPIITHLCEFVASFISLVFKQKLVQSKPSGFKHLVNEDYLVDLYQLSFAAEDLKAVLARSDSYSESSTLKTLSRFLRQHLKEIMIKSLKSDFPGKLNKFFDSFKKALNKYGIRFQYLTEIDAAPEPRYLDVIATVLIECILNSLVHAQADLLEIMVEAKRDDFKLVIKDNGKGFDLKKTLEKIKADPERYSGLRTMAFRARKCGCKLKIKSEVSKGTAVELIIKNPEESK